MASIFDSDPNGLPPRPKEKEEKRDKKRQSLTQSEFAACGRTLLAKVEKAFQTLEDAMSNADFNTAVKAAQIILDRTGFGPKSTLDVNQVTMDLSSLTDEQLRERAKGVVRMLEAKTGVASEPVPVAESGTIQ
jgi:hypothetical protein